MDVAPPLPLETATPSVAGNSGLGFNKSAPPPALLKELEEERSCLYQQLDEKVCRDVTVMLTLGF